PLAPPLEERRSTRPRRVGSTPATLSVANWTTHVDPEIDDDTIGFALARTDPSHPGECTPPGSEVPRHRGGTACHRWSVTPNHCQARGACNPGTGTSRGAPEGGRGSTLSPPSRFRPRGEIPPLSSAGGEQIEPWLVSASGEAHR